MPPPAGKLPIREFVKAGSEAVAKAKKTTPIGGQEFGSPSKLRASLAYSPTQQSMAASHASPPRKFSASPASGQWQGHPHTNTSSVLTQHSHYSTSAEGQKPNPTLDDFPVMVLDPKNFEGRSVEQVYEDFHDLITGKNSALANARCIAGHGTSVAAATNIANKGYNFNKQDVGTRLTPYEGIHTSTAADILTGYAREAADKAETDCQILLLYKNGPGGEENDVHEHTWIVGDDPYERGAKISTVISPETILENPGTYVLVALPPFAREQIPAIQQAITRGFHKAGVADAAVTMNARIAGETGLDS